MPTRNYSNVAVETTLNGGITDSATSLVVNDATGYPAVPFTIYVDSEVILVEGKSGVTFSSLTRGYDGTSQAAHSDGATVEHKVIAKDFDDRPELSEIVSVPTGVLTMYVDSATPPSGWLICDGSAVSRTTYADLFAVIGTTYGAGDGSTTFNLPDFKGVFPLGFLSGTYAMAGTGGSATHTLSDAEMPSHSHSISHGHSDNFSVGGGVSSVSDHNHAFTRESTSASYGTGSASAFSSSYTSTTGGGGGHGHSDTFSISGGVTSVSGNSGGAGSDNAHNNMPPYLVVQFIIKT